MKKRLLLGLFTLISLNVWADDPSFDSTTRIVTFPMVTIDNDKTYINVELLLSQDGTWDILTIETELNLTGVWSGELSGLTSPNWSPPIPCGTMSTEVTFIQNGNELTGVGTFSQGCLNGTGDVTGEVNGSNLAFTVTFPFGEKIIFNGSISGDYRTLVGVGNFENILTEGPWTLSLRK